MNAKYGAEPGVKIHTHVSGHFASFHSRIIAAASSEEPYVLDGLLLHESGLRPREHYTDTGGATDHVFALFHLLGYGFVPRLRDLADKRLGTVKPPATYRGIEPILGRSIRTEAIAENRDDILRLTASIRLASSPLRRCCGSSRPTNGRAG